MLEVIHKFVDSEGDSLPKFIVDKKHYDLLSRNGWDIDRFILDTEYKRKEK